MPNFDQIFDDIGMEEAKKLKLHFQSGYKYWFHFKGKTDSGIEIEATLGDGDSYSFYGTEILPTMELSDMHSASAKFPDGRIVEYD